MTRRQIGATLGAVVLAVAAPILLLALLHGHADYLARGERGILVGMIQSSVVATPLAEVVTRRKPLDLHLFDLAGILAR